MDNSANVTIIAYFNGFIIKNIEECVIFVFDKPLIIFVPQTISFEELNVVLYRGINVNTPKRVMRIRYRCSIANLNNNVFIIEEMRSVKEN